MTLSRQVTIKLPEHIPIVPSECFEQGLVYQKDKNYIKAIQCFTYVASSDTTNHHKALAFKNIALCAKSLGQYEEAAENYTFAIKLSSDPLIYLERAKSYRSSQLSEAIKSFVDFTKFLDLAYSYFYEAKYQQGKIKANKKMQEIISLLGIRRIIIEINYCLTKQSFPEEDCLRLCSYLVDKTTVLGNALAIYPDTLFQARSLANFYARLKKYNEAIEKESDFIYRTGEYFYEEGGRAASYENRGLCYYAIGDLKNAILDLLIAIKLTSSSTDPESRFCQLKINFEKILAAKTRKEVYLIIMGIQDKIQKESVIFQCVNLNSILGRFFLDIDKLFPNIVGIENLAKLTEYYSIIQGIKASLPQDMLDNRYVFDLADINQCLFNLEALIYEAHKVNFLEISENEKFNVIKEGCKKNDRTFFDNTILPYLQANKNSPTLKAYFISTESDFLNYDDYFQGAIKDIMPEVYYRNWARKYFEEQMYEKAIGFLNDFIKYDAYSAKGYLQRAKCHLALGGFIEAILDCDKALNLTPNDEETKRNIEMIFNCISRKGFIISFEKTPLNSQEKKSLLQSLLNSKASELGKIFWNKSFMITESGSWHGYFSLQLGRYNEAFASYTRAISTNDVDEDINYLLRKCHETLNDFENAIAIKEAPLSEKMLKEKITEIIEQITLLRLFQQNVTNKEVRGDLNGTLYRAQKCIFEHLSNKEKLALIFEAYQFSDERFINNTIIPYIQKQENCFSFIEYLLASSQVSLATMPERFVELLEKARPEVYYQILIKECIKKTINDHITALNQRPRLTTFFQKEAISAEMAIGFTILTSLASINTTVSAFDALLAKVDKELLHKVYIAICNDPKIATALYGENAPSPKPTPETCLNLREKIRALESEGVYFVAMPRHAINESVQRRMRQ